MGNRRSRPNREYENLVRLRDEKVAANARELEDLKNNHREQTERMNQELQSRNQDLATLRKNMMESNVKNEEELCRIRESQAQQAAELEQQRAGEIERLINSSKEEKLRATQDYENRTAQLKKEHDEEMQRSLAEMEEEKRKRDAAILKAEEERDAVARQKVEDVKNHREELERISEKHRKVVMEFFEALNKESERQTLAEIDRIAAETNQRMAIVDAIYIKMQKNTIETMYHKFFKEYVAIINRSKQLENAIEGMMEVLDVREMVADGAVQHNNANSQISNEVPYELRGLHSEFLKESSLMEHQMSTIWKNLKMCFDISDEFREQLVQPFEPYEESCRTVQRTSMKIMKAVHENNFRALAPIHETFAAHLKVLQTTIREMNSIEYRGHVENALGRIAQKSIQQ